MSGSDCPNNDHEWGQSEASASVPRYNACMATEARCLVPRTPRALAVPPYSGTALSPEELAEFIDSLEYDDTPAAVADCADYDPE
jgi:hypothetical protein